MARDFELIIIFLSSGGDSLWGSYPKSSFGETSRTSQSFKMFAVSGWAVPFSHFETAWREISIFAASSYCEKPLAFLAAECFSPNSIKPPPFSDFILAEQRSFNNRFWLEIPQPWVAKEKRPVRKDGSDFFIKGFS